MTSIVLDCDGVLADFEGAFCKKFGWENRNLVRLENRYPDKAYEIGLFSDVCRTYEQLDIVELGIKIARFCENLGFDIRVVTSRPPHTRTSTGAWLKQNKIPYTSLTVSGKHKIGKIMTPTPLFAVDDLLEVCEECAKWGIPSFLVDHPWNQKDDLDGIIYRIKTFDDFVHCFTNYFDV